MTSEHDIEVILPLVVTVKYYPGRPPPHCSNPDSPGYSDQGDSDEIEIVNIRWQSGKTVTPEQEQQIAHLCRETDIGSLYSWIDEQQIGRAHV